MKTIIVTGCLGFIGSHFTRKCLKASWNVLGIDKCTYAANVELIKEFEQFERFKFIKQDIKDIDFLPDCDYVVNFAAESHVGNSIVDCSSFLSSNILGVANLLEKIRNKQENCGPRPILLHISSDEVYGDSLADEPPKTENSCLNPSNPYSASKAAADLLILSWARTYGIEYLIVRPANNYGTHQYPEKLIPLAVKNLVNYKQIRLHNGGTPMRNWLHVEDTADAIEHLILARVKNEVYNIPGDTEQSNLETVKRILNSYPYHKEIEDVVDFSYSRPGQDVRYLLDGNKLFDLGWRNARKFSDSINLITTFYYDKFIKSGW